MIIAGLLTLSAISCSKEDDINRTEDLIGVNYWKVTGPSTLIDDQDVYVNFFYFEGEGYGTVKYVSKDLPTTLKDHTLYVDGDVVSESFRFTIVENVLSVCKSGTVYSVAEVTIKGDRITIDCDANHFFRKKPVLKRSSIESIVGSE